MSIHTAKSFVKQSNRFCFYGWKECSKHHPCEICGKPNWCRYTTDDILAMCRREGPIGEGKFDRNGDRYWIHRLRGESSYNRAFDHLGDSAKPKPAATTKPPVKGPKSIPSPHLAAELAQARLAPEHGPMMDELAQTIHVPRAVLEAIGGTYDVLHVGSGARFLWAFPAYNGKGEVVGISTRGKDGDKKTLYRTHPGVFLPDEWEKRAEQSGIIYAVEGPSDTAALWAAGLAVVGRPSNMGGVDHLAELLRPIIARVAIVVIGERDEKSDSRWPGREGALHTAQGLADALGVIVRVVLPPSGVKDSRAFFVKAAPPLDDPAAWAERGRQLESSWEAIELVTPKPKAKPIDLATVFTNEEVENIARIGADAARRRAEEEAAAHTIREALRATYRRCPNPRPPLRLRNRETHNRIIAQPSCERWDCPVCGKYLRTRAHAAMIAHLLKAERDGKTIYLAQLDSKAEWRPAYYRLRRRDVEDYCVIQDRDAKGAPCQTLLAAAPPDAAIGIKVSARVAIAYHRAALDSWIGADDPILHYSHSWKISAFDEPSKYERLGYAGTASRETIMAIAQTVEGTSVRFGDSGKNPAIVDWTEIDVGDDWLQDDLDYLDFQLEAGEAVPRSVWESLRKARAPLSGDNGEALSPESGAPAAFDPVGAYFPIPLNNLDDL